MTSSSCHDQFAVWLDSEPGYEPSEEEYQDMLYLIAYDVKEASRLRKVALACQDYGFRVEYSVFECDLSEEKFQALWNRLLQAINPDEDKLLAYRICGSCVPYSKSRNGFQAAKAFALHFMTPSGGKENCFPIAISCQTS